MAKGNRGGQRTSGSYANSPVTDSQAKIAFNSAKRATSTQASYQKNTRYENDLKSISLGRTTPESFASKLTTKQDIDNARDYLTSKEGYLNGKIQALGSKDALKKNPSLYHERRATPKALNAVNEQRKKVAPSKQEESGNINLTPTSTYNRWKKNNDSNFSAWFGRDRLKQIQGK